MEWRQIKDFPNYWVSNTGLIKSKKKILKPIISNLGRLKVSVYKNKKQKQVFISRLVASAFIQNPLNKPFVDHIDRNLKNNNKNNLRWVTQSENLLNLNTVKYRSMMLNNEKAVTVAKKNGISKTTFYRRIKNGWKIKDAAFIPLKNKKGV